MILKTKYITPDDFKEYFGIDLNNQLVDDDNISNKSTAFLKRIEDRIASFIHAQLHRDIDLLYPRFTETQKEHYKLALLEQAIYVFKNGDISVDSGYDQEKGTMINVDAIHQISIAPNCKDHLIACGIWTRKIKNKSRVGLYDGWFY